MSEAEQRRQVRVEAMQVGDVDDVGLRSKRLSRVGSDKRELQSARSEVETKHSKEDLVWKNVNHQVTSPSLRHGTKTTYLDLVCLTPSSPGYVCSALSSMSFRKSQLTEATPRRCSGGIGWGDAGYRCK